MRATIWMNEKIIKSNNIVDILLFYPFLKYIIYYKKWNLKYNEIIILNTWYEKNEKNKEKKWQGQIFFRQV